MNPADSFIKRDVQAGLQSRSRGKLLFPGMRAALACCLALLMVWPSPIRAYAVLSHEAIIDVVWESHIKPCLLKRFPATTEIELKAAQGYAYGGAIIQDMGYYPYGSHFFSDLTHYVRSGDFIVALLNDAQNVDEYAFALGALAHYAADNDGHRIGTNRAVPVLYPKLKKKYGDSVSYEQDPLAHVKTEFGFDVLEIAQKRFAPTSYHDFIGFGVSRELLDRAFSETYGIDLKSVLTDETKALSAYRHDVSKLLPEATRIAWSLKQNEIKADAPGITKRKFLYNLSRSNYEREWGKDYPQPTFKEKFLAFLTKLIPKIGPLKVLRFKTPTPETEKMFEASFNATLDRYRILLIAEREGHLKLPDDNFDVGETTGPGKYKLNDDTQATLLDKLAEKKFAGISMELRAELLEFYSDPNAPYTTRQDPKEWTRVQAEIEQLKNPDAPVVPAAAPPTP
jgi:hypothetical protein